jgi:hypothetical protein
MLFFLFGRYEGRLLMVCSYDAEKQLIPLTFALVEKNVENCGWFMSWLRREVIEPGRIYVISDQHKVIKMVFEYPQYDWSEKKWGYCASILYATYFRELVQNIS